MSDCAFLNNSGNFTAFTYNGRTIRFRTPSSLERYTDILEWDKGYLVVMAKYKGAPAEEEYIDLCQRRRGRTAPRCEEVPVI